VDRAAEWGLEVVFVATCRRVDDPEMERPHPPPPGAPASVAHSRGAGSVAAALAGIQPAPSGVVLDCLTLWMSDRLDLADDAILAAWDRELRALRAASWPAVVVGNEVGWRPCPTRRSCAASAIWLVWLGQRTPRRRTRPGSWSPAARSASSDPDGEAGDHFSFEPSATAALALWK